MSLSEEIDAVARLAASSPARYSEKDYMLETGVLAQSWQGPVTGRRAAFQEFVKNVQSQVSGPLAVLMDTTTLWTAIQLIRGDTTVLFPSTLLDLDTVVRNVILYDWIFHLPNPELDTLKVNEDIGDPVLIELQVEGIEAVLVDMWHRAKDTLEWKLSTAKQGTSAHDDFKAIEKGWAQVLGDVLETPLTGSELYDPSGLVHDWPSPASQLVRKLRETMQNDVFTHFPETRSKDMFRRDVVGYVGETNLRAVFDSELADAIGLPYSPNLARFPFYHHLFGNATATEEKLRDVQVIQGSLRNQLAKTKDLIPQAIELPAFLTSILSRIRSLDDFWAELGRLRRSADSYRRHRGELLVALRDAAAPDIDGLRKAVEEDLSAWKKLLSIVPNMTIKALPAALIGLGGGLSPAILAAVAALVSVVKGGELDAPARATIARRFRPREWFLTEFGTSVRKLLDGFSRVEDLWRVPSSRREQYKARLLQLAGLSVAWPLPGPRTV